jgi:hypothetical protein
VTAVDVDGDGDMDFVSYSEVATIIALAMACSRTHCSHRYRNIKHLRSVLVSVFRRTQLLACMCLSLQQRVVAHRLADTTFYL